MEEIQKRYIVDNLNRKIAVQIDIDLFEKIENVLEDFGLMKHIVCNDASDILEIEDAKEFYKKLGKVDWNYFSIKDF